MACVSCGLFIIPAALRGASIVRGIKHGEEAVLTRRIGTLSVYKGTLGPAVCFTFYGLSIADGGVTALAGVDGRGSALRPFSVREKVAALSTATSGGFPISRGFQARST